MRPQETSWRDSDRAPLSISSEGRGSAQGVSVMRGVQASSQAPLLAHPGCTLPSHLIPGPKEAVKGCAHPACLSCRGTLDRQVSGGEKVM